ncbi:hypothetical protein CC78DRAFT_616663 [Lojkania enalia]|uniref:RRM domain-containing protein n=1 Tax=Lojkania enalia TaxID=147567 RepID=A0A9P4KB93_9PLEO|nr:hypothetical protein CC78DRAFT_616663 [Didymosphaeria enalia]
MGPQTGVNGVLPVQVLQKNAPASAPRGPKAPQPRLRLLLRRLPPGLTKNEFDSIMGEEWKLGAGKVDSIVYKKGKVSKDSAKPSRPSRAYIHVTSQSHVQPLGDHVRQSSFIDAAKSHQDSALIGPPVLEFAPFHHIPGGRRRNDNRQGTIDQDQEFKDFLESLTNPITKPPAPEAEAPKEEKVKTTPLIEALREKKANKDKPQAKGTPKHGRGESKDDGADRAEKKILGKGSKEAATASGEKNKRLSKAEKAAKDAVKALNKEVASSKDGAASATEKATPPSPAPERKRGNASIAKSMLQRDLGLGPGPSRRRGTKRELTPAVKDIGTYSEETTVGKQKVKETPTAPTAAVATEKTVPASPKKELSRPTRAERRAMKSSLADKTNKTVGEDSKAQTKTATTPAPVILKKPQASQTPTPPKGPAASRLPTAEPATARATTAQSQATPAKTEATSSRPALPTAPQSASISPIPVITSRQAFLKHANASQGITEPLLEETLKAFGAIEKVEIDKRKGFAYVDFVEPEGLVKAIAASPVKVAQGAVQVLERKEKVSRNRPHLGPHPHATPHGPPTGPARGGRGGFAGRGRGRGGARGGGQVAPSQATSIADAAPATPSVPSPIPANDTAT